MLGPAGHFVIDYRRGLASLSPTITISVSPAGDDGQIRVGGEDGPVVRPLAFGERGRAVAQAAAAAQPYDLVCANILSTATVSPASEKWDGDLALLEALALLMAGAGQPQALPFAQVILLVAQASGWSLEQINWTGALEIDRLSYQLAAGQGETGGWKRLLLVNDQIHEVTALRHELVGDLLRRAALLSPDAPVEGPSTMEALPAGSMPASRASTNDSGPAGERRANRPGGRSSKALHLRSAALDLGQSPKATNGGRPPGVINPSASRSGRTISPPPMGGRDHEQALPRLSQGPTPKAQAPRLPLQQKQAFRLLDAQAMANRVPGGSVGRQADSSSINAPNMPETAGLSASLWDQPSSAHPRAGHVHLGGQPAAGQMAAAPGPNGHAATGQTAGHVFRTELQGAGPAQIAGGNRPGYLAPEADIEPAGLASLENMATDLADTLAALLSDEADIRGIDR